MTVKIAVGRGQSRWQRGPSAKQAPRRRSPGGRGLGEGRQHVAGHLNAQQRVDARSLQRNSIGRPATPPESNRKRARDSGTANYTPASSCATVLSRHRIDPVRGDLGERLEDEPALPEARVRHDEPGLVDDRVAIQNQVEIERARRPGVRPTRGRSAAPSRATDPEAARAESVVVPVSAPLRNSGWGADADRRRSRATSDTRMSVMTPASAVDGVAKQLTAVAEIAAQRNRDRSGVRISTGACRWRSPSTPASAWAVPRPPVRRPRCACRGRPRSRRRPARTAADARATRRESTFSMVRWRAWVIAVDARPPAVRRTPPSRVASSSRMPRKTPDSTFLPLLPTSGTGSAADGGGSGASNSASAFCSHWRCVSSRLITYWYVLLKS